MHAGGTQLHYNHGLAKIACYTSLHGLTNGITEQ